MTRDEKIIRNKVGVLELAKQLESLTITDWENHLTTLFPDVRLKRFLEMRGADGGPWARLCALPALWVGLLYDDDARAAAWDLVKDWTAADRAAMNREVPRLALRATVRNTTVGAVAMEALGIAHAGLERRGIRRRHGPDGVQVSRAAVPHCRDRLHAGGGPASRLQPPLARLRRSGVPRVRILNGRHEPSHDPSQQPGIGLPKGELFSRTLVLA